MANKTKDYLAKVRKKTGLSDYAISQKYDINQSNLSKYKSGKAALSETHAWLFAEILNINPAEVAAYTKLEQAKMKSDKSKAEFWQKQLKNLSNRSESIKIDIAQINPTVGDLDNNAQQIIDLSIEAAKQSTDLLVFTELSLVGYLPEDLLLRYGFVKQVEKKIVLIKDSIPDNISIIFGAPCKQEGSLYNSAYLIQSSQISIYHKPQRPNYPDFDEKRYFN